LVHRCRSVLVTGGAGFIGSHLVDRLVADGYEVRVLDNLLTGKVENIRGHLGKKDFHFIEGDVCDPSTLRRALKGIDVVFHEAALVSVSGSIAEPLKTNEVNTTGTLMLLKESVRSGVQRLIFASSSSIYGDQGKKPIKEDVTPKPLSPYAVSKLAAEKYCLVFDQLGQLETVCLRYFNVYGQRQRHSPYSGVITIFMERLRRKHPPVIHGDGTQTRDFVSVCDVVQANMLAMTVKNAAGEAFNIGTGHRTSICRLAEILIEASGRKNLRPICVSPRLGDIKHSCADIQKARRVLGYSPKIALEHYINEVTRPREDP